MRSILIILLLFATRSIFANNPTPGIPWPVGSEANTSLKKTLMNTYGGRADSWYASFHPGIDIDANTEASYGHQVICVEDGIVAAREPNAGGTGYYVVVVPYTGASNGWCYGHLDNSSINFGVGQPIQEGDLIGDMIEIGAMTQHLHFSWVDKNDVNVCLENPLSYLEEEPEGSSYWQFNAEEYSPEYKFLILPEKLSSE
ncbi:MAG: M23 family metallopeptidase [Candidatus Sabulitectum sp.]|nr:M23 family metallopeptidase [Candidatus Sabulitectum sp.]